MRLPCHNRRVRNEKFCRVWFDVKASIDRAKDGAASLKMNFFEIIFDKGRAGQGRAGMAKLIPASRAVLPSSKKNAGIHAGDRAPDAERWEIFFLGRS